MVTRSDYNYKKHIKDLYSLYSNNYGKDKSKKFIKFYMSRYNKFNQSFIYHRLAFALMDDYHYCKRVGSRWIAFVGAGGTGKTTFAKNVLYWLDPTITNNRINMDIVKTINSLKQIPIGGMNALLMDEPDEQFHSASGQGRLFKMVLGKARQHKIFFGICATTLSDIPKYIWQKIDIIFFLPYIGRFRMWKNVPTKGNYSLQEIREDYSKLGYKVFDKYKNKMLLEGSTNKYTPLDFQEKEYLKEKEKDYFDTIDKLHKSLMPKVDNKKKEQAKSDMMVYNLFKQIKNKTKVAKMLGYSRNQVINIVKKVQNAQLRTDNN